MSNFRVGFIGIGANGVKGFRLCLKKGYDVVVYDQKCYADVVAKYLVNRIFNESGKESKPGVSYRRSPINNKKQNDHDNQLINLADFEKYVLFNHFVERVERSHDFNNTGKVVMTVTNLKTNRKFQEIVDLVIICKREGTEFLRFNKTDEIQDQNVSKNDIDVNDSHLEPNDDKPIVKNKMKLNSKICLILIIFIISISNFLVFLYKYLT